MVSILGMKRVYLITQRIWIDVIHHFEVMMLNEIETIYDFRNFLYETQI